jgi:hypothetical protein
MVRAVKQSSANTAAIRYDHNELDTAVNADRRVWALEHTEDILDEGWEQAI